VDTKEISKNISDCVQRNAADNKYFNKNMKMVYECSLTDKDKDNLQDDNRSTLTFSIVKPLLQHQLKNINDSTPSAKVIPVESDPNPQDQEVADGLTAKLDSIYEANQYQTVVSRCAELASAGGKGIFKIKTDYVNNVNFQQKLLIESCEDPTQVHFDPCAKEPTKQDAEYVFERIGIEESKLKRLYDINTDDILKNCKNDDSNVCWVETTKEGKNIFYVVDYYYKKHTSKTIYLIDKNGDQIVTSDKPKDKNKIVSQREVDEIEIAHIRLCADVILEKESTLNFRYLPYVFLSSDTKMIDGKEINIAFAQPAIDAQRVKNIAFNYLFFEMTNNVSGRYVIARESLNDALMDAIENPTQKKTLVYDAREEKDTGEILNNPPPEYHAAPPIPEQYIGVFREMDETINTILGSQYQSLDQTNMSGQALFNLADFMNASTATLMTNIINATAQIAKIALSAFPFIYSQEEVDISKNKGQQRLVQLDFEEMEMEKFAIDVKKGVNYALQQQMTVEQIAKFSQLSPSLAGWLNQEGMVMMLENMPLNNKSKIISSYEGFLEEQEQKQQQASQQPNPDAIKAQAEMLNAQNQQMQLQLEAQKLTAEAQKNAANSALNLHKINTDRQKAKVNANIDIYGIKSENQRELLRHTDKVGI
jgi:hypothetical protein